MTSPFESIKVYDARAPDFLTSLVPIAHMKCNEPMAKACARRSDRKITVLI